MRLIDADELQMEPDENGMMNGVKFNMASRLKNRRYAISLLKTMIDNAPTVESIPKGAYEQVKWERDMAVQQLNDYGVQLGEKADVQAVVRCKDCRRERYCEFTQYQGMNGYCSLAESKDGD